MIYDISQPLLVYKKPFGTPLDFILANKLLKKKKEEEKACWKKITQHDIRDR